MNICPGLIKMMDYRVLSSQVLLCHLISPDPELLIFLIRKKSKVDAGQIKNEPVQGDTD